MFTIKFPIFIAFCIVMFLFEYFPNKDKRELQSGFVLMITLFLGYISSIVDNVYSYIIIALLVVINVMNVASLTNKENKKSKNI